MEFKFMEDRIKELEEKGHFICSNRELANALYKKLKPKYPLLYQWNDGVFDRLNIITDRKEVLSLMERREELEAKIADIDVILHHFAKKHMPELLQDKQDGNEQGLT